jgi:phosphoglycolate phosphatase
LYYVGDENRDIDAANNAGIGSIAVTWGYRSESLLSQYHPDCLIRSPEELLVMLK